MPSIRTITRVCLGAKRCIHWANPVPWSASVIDRAKIREAFKRGNAIYGNIGARIFIRLYNFRYSRGRGGAKEFVSHSIIKFFVGYLYHFPLFNFV